VPNAAPDTVTIIDLGPPMSVAITPDQGLALVTSSTKKDPADATKTVPDNRLTVVDLRATPPAVIATLEPARARRGSRSTGKARSRSWPIAPRAACGCSRSRARPSRPRAWYAWGTTSRARASPPFTRDGRAALVTRDGDTSSRSSRWTAPQQARPERGPTPLRARRQRRRLDRGGGEHRARPGRQRHGERHRPAGAAVSRGGDGGGRPDARGHRAVARSERGLRPRSPSGGRFGRGA
jgi:hypothetical protein